MLRASSGSISSINSVDPLMSANSAVTVLRTPYRLAPCAHRTRRKTRRPPDCRCGISRKSSVFAEFVEQRLGVLQIGGVEALGEPAIDLGEHRSRFIAIALR